MRSRRFAMRARRSALSDLRSSRLRLGPARVFRRARAWAAVMGAGATGPFFFVWRRTASLRLGVGRPFGLVVRDPPAASDVDAPPELAVPPSGSVVSDSPSEPFVSPFLRPNNFTVARLLCGLPAPEFA